MTEFQITWHVDQDEKHRDSAWYTDGYGSPSIATVKSGDREVTVEVCGEMRLYVPYRDDNGAYDFTSEGEVVRYADKLRDHVTNDDELSELSAACEAAGWELWQHNSWFEVYEIDPDNEYSYDTAEVEHDLFDAIEKAKQILSLPKEQAA